ncbi:unnamed protein product [Urochloa humidicola]
MHGGTGRLLPCRVHRRLAKTRCYTGGVSPGHRWRAARRQDSRCIAGQMLGSQAEPSWREFAKPAFAFELEAWWRHSPSRTVLLAAVLGEWPPMRPCAAWLSYATEATAEWRLGKANAMQRTWRPFDAGTQQMLWIYNNKL